LRIKNNPSSRQLQRRALALDLLGKHHTRPQYKERAMSWNRPAWTYQTPKRQTHGGNGYKTQKNQPKKAAEADSLVVGFDGKKVPLAMPSCGSSSSQESELVQLKDLMKQMVGADLKSLTPEQQALLKTSPRESLREAQKALNQQRKEMNKKRNLETKIEDNERRYEAWVQAQKLLLKQEKERFLAEQDRLRQELAQLNRPQEADMMEDSEEDSELFGHGASQPKKDQEMERRLQIAEQQAQNAQEAFMMMQAQLQQVLYHQVAALGTPLAAAPAAMEMPNELPAPHASLGTTPLPSTSPATAAPSHGSPQLPKGVRKEALKIKEKTAAKAPVPKKKEDHAKDTIVVPDEEEQNATDSL
jgi:hypothetical protein